MRSAGSLAKIGVVFTVVIFTGVAPCKSAYAQTRIVGNFGVGSFHGRPGFAPDRGFPFRGNFRFRGGFGRQGFGTNIVVVPSAGLAEPYYGVPPPPDYGVPPPSYYGLSPCYGQRGTILHRQVDTPNGPALQPVYVC
jgi:hypothetical protein